MSGYCGTAAPLAIHPEFSGQTFKHLPVPVWLLRDDYGKRSFHVVVNGATGRWSRFSSW